MAGEARLSVWDSETGKELWQPGYATTYEHLYQYSGSPRASPPIDGDRVYTYGVEGRLRAYSAETGKGLWDVDTVAKDGVIQNSFGVGATPIIEGDLLIAPVGASPAGPMLRYPAWSAPVLAHGRLYMQGKDQILCLDLAPASKSEAPSKHKAGG